MVEEFENVKKFLAVELYNYFDQKNWLEGIAQWQDSDFSRTLGLRMANLAKNVIFSYD